MKSDSDRASGFILISTLLGLGILSVITIGTYHYALRTIRLHTRTIAAVSAEHDAYNNVLSEFASSSSPIEGDIHCTIGSATVLRSKISKEHCRAYRGDSMSLHAITVLSGVDFEDPKLFPFFAINQVFEGGVPCFGLGRATFPPTPLPAITAPTTCRFYAEPGDRIFRGNIELETPLTLARSVDSHLLLAATGYLYTSSTITLGGDTTIYAAGNIELDTLAAAPGTTVKVTVVTPSGAVTIRSLSGVIQLKVIAKAWTRLPADALLGHDALPAVPAVKAIPLTLRSAQVD